MSSTIVYYAKKTVVSTIHAIWLGMMTAVGLTLIVIIIGIVNLMHFFGLSVTYSLHP